MIKMTAGRKFSAGAAMRCAKAGILIVFGLLLNTPPLAAAESEMTQEYVTCMEKPGGVTAEMIECMSAETARQDARLNENYKRLMSKLSASSSSGNEVPHIFTRKSRLQPGEFLVTSAKRLLQQYLPRTDIHVIVRLRSRLENQASSRVRA
jgi:uncharacterized protein YecT (DUF1311 family)